MTNQEYHKHFRELKEDFGLNNKMIADITGHSVGSIQNQTNKSKPFPRVLKFAVWVYVNMRVKKRKTRKIKFR